MNGSFRPRLTLRTLGRGDGLLGMMGFKPDGAATGKAPARFGPRADSVTVVQVDWTYTGGKNSSQVIWECPAPTTEEVQHAALPGQAAQATRYPEAAFERDLHAQA